MKDEAGNATITSIPYNFDKTAPTGRINTKNQMEFSESKDLYGTAYITGIADLDEGQFD